ncbi:glycine cleavage system H-protein subunit [Sorochytrium milnesiophthora]
MPRAIHNIYGLTAWILRPFTWTAHQLLAFTVHFALSAYTGLTQSLLEWMAAQSSRYARSHEWVSVENGVGTVGISDYAAKALGDVVYVELPTVGNTVEQQGTSVKAASDIYAPVSGEIIEVNEQLDSEPSLINSSAFDKGWLCKIKLSDEKQLSGLLDDAAYTKHTTSSSS